MADSIIVFDGVCVLCSRWVGFVVQRDPRGQYKFAAMQTSSGRNLLVAHGIDPDDPLSFLLLEGGSAYTDTDAIVRILRSLGSGWRVAAVLLSIVPRFVRDLLYRWVARRRYRLFGRREACVVPTADIADRFLR
ncbi:MAG TPA: DCC1-like thiol-disulfide oxidoreductase family protein [Steroidobacteraceae bacterium]|jgi:predicted DCC family thiol-disulfide oxidoreductase YuxK|nr:DCC1-like thiol-disulfide oxidoreductase family protein [Steroidobacteraceae bacterium]